MAQLQKPTLENMRKLHAALVTHGPLSVSLAAKRAGLHKGSSQDWMNRLLSLGCVAELPRGQITGPRNNAKYFMATSVPVPAAPPAADCLTSPLSQGSEFRRTIRPAVQLGLKRDDLLTAFYGAPVA